MSDLVLTRTPLIALAGPPNVGKSTIFNALTGLSQHVGNWPGKTVEIKSGLLQLNGSPAHLVDLPGTYSLSANSPEELIARDMLLHDHPDLVVVVVNAAVLERTLYLLAEIAELGIPVVTVVNMIDVARDQGLQIDLEALEVALGVPVVGLTATQSSGYQQMIQVMADVLAGRRSALPRPPELGPALEALLDELELVLRDQPLSDYPRRWLALKLLEGDREVNQMVQAALPPARWQQVDALLARHENAVLEIASARYAWIGRITHAAVQRPSAGAITLTERLDRVATHPVWGAVMLVAVLAAVYSVIFVLSQPLVAVLDLGLGALSSALRAALSSAPSWLSSLLADGLVGGVGTVLTMLPVLALFFAAIGLLEDTGYLARAAFVTDRLMHTLGLHGKSFLPLFLGMGCNVPAVMGTRILDSPRERLLTMLLIPLVPCAGRMAVLLYFSGTLYGAWGPLVILALLALAAGAILLTGLLLRRTVLPGVRAAFIMELPLYHLPNLRTIGLYTWQHVLDFLKRAATVILVVSLVIWLLATLPSGNINTSWLAQVGHWLAPLGGLMGLDWRMMVALLASVTAKEQTLATLGILTAETGQTLNAVLPQMLTPAAGIAFLVVQMLFIPCAGTLSTLRAETHGWRLVLFSVLYLAVLSFGLGILIYQLALLLGWGV